MFRKRPDSAVSSRIRSDYPVLNLILTRFVSFAMKQTTGSFLTASRFSLMRSDRDPTVRKNVSRDLDKTFDKFKSEIEFPECYGTHLSDGSAWLTSPDHSRCVALCYELTNVYDYVQTMIGHSRSLGIEIRLFRFSSRSAV